MKIIIKGANHVLLGGKAGQSMVAQIIIMKYYVGGIMSSKQNEC